MGVTVRAADGREWHVRRRWFRRPRWRDLDEWGDAPWEQALFIDELSGLVVAVVLFLVFGLLIILVLPLAFFLVEAIVLAVAAYVLGRNWLVEAETSGPPRERLAWRVRGWRRSRRAVAEVAAELRAGIEAAPADSQPVTHV